MTEGGTEADPGEGRKEESRNTQRTGSECSCCTQVECVVLSGWLTACTMIKRECESKFSNPNQNPYFNLPKNTYDGHTARSVIIFWLHTNENYVMFYKLFMSPMINCRSTAKLKCQRSTMPKPGCVCCNHEYRNYLLRPSIGADLYCNINYLLKGILSVRSKL